MVVHLKLHPLSWRVLRRDNKWDGKAVTITDPAMYNVFVALLRRKDYVNASDIRRQSSKLVPGDIVITDCDYWRYGGFISADRMDIINSIIYEQERNIICHLVMAAKVSGAMSRNAAIKYFLDLRDIEPEELNYENVRKYYQRNFREMEDRYYDDIQNTIISNNTHNKHI